MLYCNMLPMEYSVISVDIVVGFEESSIEVLESAGSVSLCVSAFDTIPSDVEFSLTAATRSATASTYLLICYSS